MLSTVGRLPRLVAHLRKSAFAVLTATFLTSPVIAQCIVICYGTNPGVSITSWSGFWDSMMGYWTYTWTETWTWDCTNTGCTASCELCEKGTLFKSTDGGTTWSPLTPWTNNVPASVCANGNTDVWNASINLYPSTMYNFSWLGKCPSVTDSCNSVYNWEMPVQKQFTTGPGM